METFLPIGDSSVALLGMRLIALYVLGAWCFDAGSVAQRHRDNRSLEKHY